MSVDPFAEGYVDGATAKHLIHASGLGQMGYLRSLIERAKALSRPYLSDYRVGAAGIGGSGAIYLGANIEFSGRELCHTIHAEQSVVINAMIHGETALAALAISAAPCGSCRQFLRELADAERLEIWLARPAPFSLADFLPDSFGPEDLGVTGALLKHGQQTLRAEGRASAPQSPEARAVEAARTSYAPYTKAYAGCALTLADGSLWAGSYIENAAFNPSIAPGQAAVVALTMAGRDWSEIRAAVVAQVAPQAIDHADATRRMLAAMGCAVDVTVIKLQNEGDRPDDRGRS